MEAPVKISFECLPLRSVGRLDVPLDAPDEYRQRSLRLKQAILKHGAHNSYLLHDGRVEFQLTNNPAVGMLRFRFEGTVLTDSDDRRTRQVDLDVEIEGETCDWLSRPVVDWFGETVRRAVAVEFDRYIATGDLARSLERLQTIQQQSDAVGGYLGMGL